ncbi:uncharacterized protein LOC114304907 [Camellia sinensis]|uniref:uncharacterized protein LOC114304907 n=1 Tax=Camellia sinensis TaxID=4442 RepID=UPI001036BEC0|nr:uncharacterized protein LOC114304907 [Camellia sinensis]
MNTDGSSKGDPGDSGFGGLIRDEKGIWLCGYFDSQYAIDMLKGNIEVTSPLRSLVEDSKFLIQRCGFSIQHVKRKGNKSADGLAKMGLIKMRCWLLWMTLCKKFEVN